MERPWTFNIIRTKKAYLFCISVFGFVFALHGEGMVIFCNYTTYNLVPRVLTTLGTRLHNADHFLLSKLSLFIMCSELGPKIISVGSIKQIKEEVKDVEVGAKNVSGLLLITNIDFLSPLALY